MPAKGAALGKVVHGCNRCNPCAQCSGPRMNASSLDRVSYHSVRRAAVCVLAPSTFPPAESRRRHPCAKHALVEDSQDWKSIPVCPAPPRPFKARPTYDELAFPVRAKIGQGKIEPVSRGSDVLPAEAPQPEGRQLHNDRHLRAG